MERETEEEHIRAILDTACGSPTTRASAEGNEPVRDEVESFRVRRLEKDILYWQDKAKICDNNLVSVSGSD